MVALSLQLVIQQALIDFMPRILLRFLVWVLLGGITLVHAAEPALEITGASKTLEANIRAYLDLSNEPCDAAEWRLRAVARDLDARIQDAGRALGYYHLTSQKTFSRPENCWHLALAVTPGEPVRLSAVSIALEGEGQDSRLLNSIADDSGLDKGDRLNHGHYDRFKRRLLLAANTQGYFDANYRESEVLVSVEKNTARVNLLLDTGVRYRLGAINVTHDILSDNLIDRYITLETGQEYRAEDLQQLKSELRASRYFAGVSITPDLDNTENREVPIDIELVGGPKHSYSAGIGYATDTGPRVLLGYENRYLNRRGHKFDADVNASESITTYQVSYSIPMERPAYDVLQLFTGFEQEELNDWESNRLATGISYSTWQTSQWLNTYSLSAEREDYIFGEAPGQRSELLIPMYSASVTRGPQTGYPLSGWSLLVRLKGTDESFGSSTDFLQGYGRVKYIHKLGPGRLLLRAEGGITEVDDFDKLPISLRFFAGGDASVRGYGYKTLGPVNADDIVVGGSRLLTGSVEYDYKVLDDWAVAAFWDEGSAFNKGYVDRYRGVGMGLRWISPVGPVRVDVARALDGDKGWRVHLSVGPDL